MKTIFNPKLVNHPFGDPGMVVEFMFDRRSLLFDLGNLGPLSSGDLLKISDVFVSHTHIDHFIGFDYLLRVCFGHNQTIRMYGPENFLKNVEGKLAGFTWNLVDRYEESLTLIVHEVSTKGIRKAVFRAIDRFRRSEECHLPFNDGILLEEKSFTVRTAILEHRVPCLGFAMTENYHINIKKDRLYSLGFLTGPWLNHLKELIYQNRPLDTQIRVPVGQNGTKETKEFTLGDLRSELVTISSGQKIAYITDTVFRPENNRRIVELVQGSDRFFCESPFLSEEEDRGRERYHLTAGQAGALARMAEVKRLTVFHFSSRHANRKEQLIREALSAFRGSPIPIQKL